MGRKYEQSFMIRPKKTELTEHELHSRMYHICCEIIEEAKKIRDAGYNPKFVCPELEERDSKRRALLAKKDI